MRILVTGAVGFLGTHVVRTALDRGHQVVGVTHRAPGQLDGVTWTVCDVTDAAAVRRLVEEHRPDTVVNLAYVMGDWAVTAEGAAHVAAAAAGIGAHLVQMSTDCVFSGGEPLTEDTPPAPRQPYGAAKAAAELVARALVPGAAVVRTSVLFGEGDGFFDRLVVDLAHGAEGGLFTDQWRCHADVRDVAAGIVEVAERGLAGVFHLAGPLTSRADAGRDLAARLGLDPERVPVRPAPEMDAVGLRRPDLRCERTYEVLTARVRGLGVAPG